MSQPWEVSVMEVVRSAIRLFRWEDDPELRSHRSETSAETDRSNSIDSLSLETNFPKAANLILGLRERGAITVFSQGGREFVGGLQELVHFLKVRMGRHSSGTSWYAYAVSDCPFVDAHGGTKYPELVFGAERSSAPAGAGDTYLYYLDHSDEMYRSIWHLFMVQAAAECLTVFRNRDAAQVQAREEGGEYNIYRAIIMDETRFGITPDTTKAEFVMSVMDRIRLEGIGESWSYSPDIAESIAEDRDLDDKLTVQGRISAGGIDWPMTVVLNFIYPYENEIRLKRGGALSVVAIHYLENSYDIEPSPEARV